MFARAKIAIKHEISSCISHHFVGKQTEGKKRHVNELCIVGVHIAKASAVEVMLI